MVERIGTVKRAIMRVAGFFTQMQTDLQESRDSFEEGVGGLSVKLEAQGHPLRKQLNQSSRIEDFRYSGDLFMPPADPLELVDRPIKVPNELPHAPQSLN